MSAADREYLNGWRFAASMLAGWADKPRVEVEKLGKGGIGCAIGIRHRFRPPFGTYEFPVDGFADGEADAYLAAFGLGDADGGR